MFILYKKYESSWIATQISWWGFLLVFAGAGAAGSGIATSKAVNSGLTGLSTVLGFAVGIVVFVFLKILLNKLTDKIAQQTTETQKKAEQERTITENFPLRIPAHLTIIRDSNFVAALVPCPLFLNNVQVASLKNGESVTIPITMKHNILQTNTVDINSKPAKGTWHKFEAQDSANGEIHLSAGIFKPLPNMWKPA
jgi:hypothetical protein